MISLLDAAETDEKADGCVYYAAVLGQINHEEMLRLCDIVRKCFVFDFMQLPNFIEPTSEDTITTQNLTNVRLIDNFSGGYWKGNSKIALNELGEQLYTILLFEGYFKN